MFVAMVLVALGATSANAQERISLQEVPFWTHGADVWGLDEPKSTPAECAWEVGTPSGLPYGDGGVQNFADLSSYSKLIITATEGTPRIMMNRTVNEGQWDADVNASKLFEYPKDGWVNDYVTKEEAEGVATYTVNLKKMVKDFGFAYLHAIKGANWQDVTVLSMEVELGAKPVQVGWVNMINNSDMEGDDVSSFFVKEYPATSPSAATISPEVGVNYSKGIVVNSAAKVANDYDSQFWFRFNEEMTVGTKYRVTFDYRADVAQNVGTQSHVEPSQYIYYDLWGNIAFTPEWQTFTKEGEITETIGVQGDTGMKFRSAAFNLSGDTDNKFYFDNIKFEIYKYGTAVEFNSDVIRVDFGNDTNVADLVKAGGLPRLMYPLDCASVKVNGKAVELYSVEGFKDGRFYIFLNEPVSETDEVLVSFKNPADAAYHLIFTNGIDKGKDVSDFTDVEASNNPEVEENEGYPYDYVTPVVMSADPEDGSFNLPNSIKEFKLVFDKEVDCKELKATLNGEALGVVPATDYSKEITLTREGADLPDGEYTINVTKIFPKMNMGPEVYGDTTYTFNIGKVVDDPNDVEETIMKDDFAASGDTWITTSDTQGEMQSANAGGGSRLMHGQSGFAADILYLCTRGNSSTGGIAMYGTKTDAKLALKAKTYHLTLGVAKWDGNGAARSLKVQVLPEDAVDSNNGLILDESKILVEERKAVEPDFKTSTNATRFDIKVPVTVEGNYVIRMVCGNADGNPAGYNDGCAIGDVKVEYLPNKVGAEWVRLLKAALESAKKVNDKFVAERYAGEAQTALAQAIAKYEGEMENYTAPSVYQNAATDLETLSKALENHGKLCDDYDTQIKKAIDVVRQNAEKKFATLQLYAQVSELAAKYHGTSEWRNVNEDPEGEPNNQLFYEFDKLTDDAQLQAAITELTDIVTLTSYLFTEGESKSTTTGVAAEFERLRIGIETLKTLGVAEDDALIAEASKLVADDDNAAEALMNRTAKETYGKLKDNVNIFEKVDNSDPENPVVSAQQFDFSVFFKNPNVYKTQTNLNCNAENVPGWNISGSTGLWCGWNNSVKNIEGVAEDCSFTIYHAAGVAEQTIYNLPAGVYNIVVDAARWDEVDPTGQTFAYYKTSATPAVEEGAEPQKDVNFAGTADLAYRGQYVMNYDNIFENVTITDGQLTVGVNFASDNGQYFFDKVKVFLVGKAEGFDYAKAFDETVGISQTVAAEKAQNGAIYNMAGQKVSESYKGLVIKNGKKFVIK